MNKTPFVIRGHHLALFADVASGGQSPDGLAKSIVRARRQERLMIPESQEYARDVIGSTENSARIVERRYRAAFMKFLGLAAEDQVLITLSAKNPICDSCIVGRHCLDRGAELAIETEHGQVQVYETDLEDMAAIGRFKNLAGKLAAKGVLTNPSAIREQPVQHARPSQTAVPIEGSNMLSYEAPIETEAGYLKAVLTYWPNGVRG